MIGMEMENMTVEIVLWTFTCQRVEAQVVLLVVDMVVNRTCIGNMSSDWISYFDRNIDLGVKIVEKIYYKLSLKSDF